MPQFPPGYFALGYGGNGITSSYIAAGLLVDLFLQRRNPDLEIFRFDRGVVIGRKEMTCGNPHCGLSWVSVC